MGPLSEIAILAGKLLQVDPPILIPEKQQHRIWTEESFNPETPAVQIAQESFKQFDGESATATTIEELLRFYNNLSPTPSYAA